MKCDIVTSGQDETQVVRKEILTHKYICLKNGVKEHYQRLY